MSLSLQTAAGEALRGARKLVVKVGSAILCGETGVRAAWLAALGADIAARRREGVDVLVVTSGAVALGRRRLGLAGALRLDEKQAASAAGQAALIEAWQRALAPYGIVAAQLLLTLSDAEDRRRYLNARATIRTLLDRGALPIVNENDTVATSEIRYGDNDRLAAHTAQMVGADLLLILSDVDGVYTDDPRTNPAATRIPVIDAVTSEIERAAGGANASAGVGSGGMASKIAAARIAGRAGCACVIAPGLQDHPLAAALEGGPATLIRAEGSPERARRQWIAGRLKPAGRLHVDAGAVAALRGGASLLPAGVVAVDGVFARGDAVAVSHDGADIGQGLSAYDSADLVSIAGRRSEEIEVVLGYPRRPAAIEKDDLVLTDRASS